MRSIPALVAALVLTAGTARAQDEDDQLDNPQAQPGQPYAQPYQTPPQYEDAPQYDPNGVAYGYGFVGPHPVPYQNGSGFCYIEGAHSHEYGPFDEYLFREYNGYYYFVAACPNGTRDGSHYFAATLPQHNANIAKANAECAGA